VPALLVFLYSVLFYTNLFCLIHIISPKFSQVTTGFGTSHLKYKIYNMSKTQEYFLGCYAMFSDKYLLTFDGL